MPIVHDKYTPDCHKYIVTDAEGNPTGDRVTKTTRGQKNVDLGNDVFVPYVWDEPSQSIRYGDLSCEFYSAGYQVVREFGSPETLIDDQRFEVQYWQTQAGGRWWPLDLYQVGLTVDQQDDYCIVTRILSDGLGNTLDVEFLFRPMERVKLTFRLHVVDTDLTYRIRFQNTGIAGEVTEVPAININRDNLGTFKLLFDNIQFQWDAVEIGIHNYTLEDRAGGKKLDLYMEGFVLDANGDVVISPATWGPTTIVDADDGVEYNDTTWFDDFGGEIFAGKSSGGVYDAGMMWTVTDADLPGATINAGTKITINIDHVDNAGIDGLLTLVDNRTPGTWGSSNRPSQLTKHPDTVEWDEPNSGVQDSPELNSFIQQRIDGDDVAAAFVSGDKIATAWEDVASGSDDLTVWAEGVGDLTIVYTPGGTTYYQAAGQGAIAPIGVLTKAVTFVKATGGYSVTIVGILVKKTSKSVGGGQTASTGILSKKTSKDVGGGSVTSAGTLTTAIMYMQAVGGASMSIAGSLATQFIAGTGAVINFIRRRKTFYKQ